MEKYKYGVLIGRFQPFHSSHLRAIREAFLKVEELILIVGSSNASRSIKNPFTFEERKQMINNTLLEECPDNKWNIVPARDYFYSDETWVVQIQNIVADIAGDEPNICLIGNYKDASSYYMNLFPQWELVIVSPDTLNATDIRNYFFEHTNTESLRIPFSIATWLEENFLGTDTFSDLASEYEMIRKYHKSWESAPFPPTFVTVDAVVVHLGHILVVRRKFVPGKGLLALPGGFIKQNERLEHACIRELKEETGIKVHSSELQKCIVGNKVFDYPGRSTRGRTITHAFHFNLGRSLSKELPSVKGGDDASHAKWLPVRDIFKDGIFYEDHASIMEAFLATGG